MLRLPVNLWKFLLVHFAAGLTKNDTPSSFYPFVLGFVFYSEILVAVIDNFATRQYLLQIVKSELIFTDANKYICNMKATHRPENSKW